MIGITLSPEQIRSAPPEVRRWLEQQIGRTFGLGGPPQELPEAHQNLVECDPDDVRAILSVIQKLPPVVLVFFDLARESATLAAPGIRALRVEDMVRNCHLQAPVQIAACLETLNQALRHLSGNPGIAVAVVDEGGHCLVADTTARAILSVWQDMVGAHNLELGPTEATVSPPLFTPPYMTTVPISPGPIPAAHAPSEAKR